jgi:hypothetical protein
MTLAFFTSARIEDRREQLLKLIGRVAQDGRFPVDELLLDHVDGELQRGGRSALAVTRLQHEQLAFLDGELDVLHVLEVLLEDACAPSSVRRRTWASAVFKLRHGLRRAHAGDDVFALGVDQEFAVELILSVCRVARERHA